MEMKHGGGDKYMMSAFTKRVKNWTWNDLHKKIVKVVYYEANPEVLEPETLAFYDIENNTIYYAHDMKVGGT